jgi:hypothetical protein
MSTINFNLFGRKVRVHDWRPKPGQSDSGPVPIPREFGLSEGFYEGTFQGIISTCDEAGRQFSQALVLIMGELELREVDLRLMRFEPSASTTR